MGLSEKNVQKERREGNMQKVLVVVDMQNDFIDGALGTKEAVAIVPGVKEKIEVAFLSEFDDSINQMFTLRKAGSI